MTHEERKKLRELAEKATDFAAGPDGSIYMPMVGYNDTPILPIKRIDVPMSRYDFEFYESAKRLVPSLLDQLDEAEKALEAIASKTVRKRWKMKAGRELDALIGEKVFGKKPCFCDEDKLRLDWMKKREEALKDPFANHAHFSQFFRYGSDGTCNFCGKFYKAPGGLSYSKDIAAAWEVVEKLDEDGFKWICVWKDAISFVCQIHKFNPPPERIYTSAQGNTAPHAICLAALKVVGVEV